MVDRLTGWSRVLSFSFSFSFPLGWADVTAARTAGRVVRPFLRGRGKFAGEFRGDDGWISRGWAGMVQEKVGGGGFGDGRLMAQH